MLKFNNTRDAAKEVLNELNYFKKQYTAKPIKKPMVDGDLWVITPGGESTAYKYGKYAFSKQNGGIYLGVNVEKGLGEELSEYYPKSLIMNEEWFFHKLIMKLRIGEAKKVLTDLKGKINKPIYIDIQTNMNGVKIEEGGSYTRFELTEDGVNVINQMPTVSDKIDIAELNKRPNLKLNMGLKDAKTLGEIAEVIRSMDKSGELKFLWLDFFVWIPFEKCDESIEGVGLDEKDIINILINPLKTLVR